MKRFYLLCITLIVLNEQHCDSSKIVWCAISLAIPDMNAAQSKQPPFFTYANISVGKRSAGM